MEFLSPLFDSLPLSAVVASTLTILLIGALWHSRFLFGRAWIRMSGIRPGDVRAAEAKRRVIYRIIMAMIIAVLLGLVAQYSDNAPDSISCAVLFIWLFIMLDQLNSFIWRREPFAFFLLQTSRSLACLLGGALVYTFWS